MVKNELEAALEKSRNASTNKTSLDGVILLNSSSFLCSLSLSFSLYVCLCVCPCVRARTCVHVRESLGIDNSHCPQIHSFVVSSLHKRFLLFNFPFPEGRFIRKFFKGRNGAIITKIGERFEGSTS